MIMTFCPRFIVEGMKSTKTVENLEVSLAIA